MSNGQALYRAWVRPKARQKFGRLLRNSCVKLRHEYPFLAKALVFYALYKLVKVVVELSKGPKDLYGKLVVVTGGANGLGKCISLRLRDFGARVIVWDIDKAALEAIKDDVEGAVYVDVSNEESVISNAKILLDKYEKIDVLINNAGIISGREILELNAAAIQKTFSVNVFAHFWTVKAFLPRMMEYQEGHIVTVCSVAGLEGAPKLAEYCSSKFASFGFSEALRREIRQSGYNGIKTTCVSPYFFIGNDVPTQRFAPWPLSWLVPVLRTGYVARKIVDAIRWEKTVVILPRFLALLNYVKGLVPIWIKDSIASQLTDMSHYVELHGHKVGQEGFVGSRHQTVSGERVEASGGFKTLTAIYSRGSAQAKQGGIAPDPRAAAARSRATLLHAMRRDTKNSAPRRSTDEIIAGLKTAVTNQTDYDEKQRLNND